MNGYTPGPWHWVDPGTDQPATGGYASLRTVEEFGENKTEVRDGKSYTIFALPKWVLDAEDVSPEDARLIAAAPDLLEACRDALVALRLSANEFVPEQNAIEAAILKATEAASCA